MVASSSGALPSSSTLHLIQLAQQIDLTALLFEVELRIRQRLNLLPRIGLDGGNERALIDRGEKSRTPPADSAVSGRILRQHDESRQILVLRAETIRNPRAHRRPAGPVVSRVHHQHGRSVVGDVGDHRTNLAEFVDDAAHLREDLADLRSILAVPGPRERRAH